MKKISLLLSLIISMNFVYAQDDLKTKISTDVCQCLENASKNNSTQNFEELTKECMMTSTMKYSKEVKAYANGSQEKLIKFSTEVGQYLAVNCPAFMKLFNENNGAATIKNKENPFDSTIYKKANCDDFKSGNFKTIKTYVNGKPVPENDPSAFSISKDGIWTDFTENKKYKTESYLKKLDDCKFELTLKSNTNPVFDSFMKVGEKMYLIVLGVDKKNPSKYYVKMEFKGMIFYAEYQRNK